MVVVVVIAQIIVVVVVKALVVVVVVVVALIIVGVVFLAVGKSSGNSIIYCNYSILVLQHVPSYRLLFSSLR